MNLEQAQNTKILLDVIQAKIDRNDPPEFLDSWVQPCGTHGCVLGDYVIARGLHSHKSIVLGEGFHNVEQIQVSDEVDYACGEFLPSIHFGFNPETSIQSDNYASEDLDIFGISVDGSLEQRYNYVKQQLIDSGYEHLLEQDHKAPDWSAMLEALGKTPALIEA